MRFTNPISEYIKYRGDKKLLKMAYQVRMAQTMMPFGFEIAKWYRGVLEDDKKR